MTDYRQESDLLGSMEIPTHVLWGVYTQRAIDNFPLAGRPVSGHLVRAYGAVKLACARTNHELGRWDETQFAAIESACSEMWEGRLDEHVVVDALQGGAGTSTNMNVNEVLANRALQLLGHPPGTYETIHPLEDINLHQSTNDTFPTALKVAAIVELRALDRDVTSLVDAFQAKEKQFDHVVRVARTQLQDAVLTTLGRQMSAYAEAFARDRWRIYKCEERLRMVNLGGTAIGTGLGAPRQYIFRVVDRLREITGIGLARAENLVEATQNTDLFVEVSGILRALATNLLKVANDLRLLASGPNAGLAEIRLPPRQAGSSLMPGKVNPVIPEAVGQAAIAVAAHDQALATACSQGNLELNQYMPLIADCLLTSLDLLRRSCRILMEHCVQGIEADETRCRTHVDGAAATATALVDCIGYEAAQSAVLEAAREGRTIKDVVLGRGLLDESQFDQLTSADAVTRLGSVPRQADDERADADDTRS